MRFVAIIEKEAGGFSRQVKFSSEFDATDVLVSQVEREVLAEGEKLGTMASSHRPSERVEDRVPAIWRVA
jgi:hypothetical protein